MIQQQMHLLTFLNTVTDEKPQVCWGLAQPLLDNQEVQGLDQTQSRPYKHHERHDVQNHYITKQARIVFYTVYSL